MPVSKTDFIRGTQCEKMLWLDSHMPHLKIIPPKVQELLDQGNEFGDKAMGIFGSFIETTAYKEDGRLNYSQMIKTTASLLLKEEEIICEGAFSWLGNFCAADILRKRQNKYDLYEVKNSALIKQEFLLDLAFQTAILKKCGVNVGETFLILNGDKVDENTLKNSEQGGQVCVERIKKDGITFAIFCVSDKVRVLEKNLYTRLFELGKIKKKDAPMPDILVGAQCETPYLCWYFEHCHGACGQAKSLKTDDKTEIENTVK